MKPSELLRVARDPAFFRRVAPSLHIGSLPGAAWSADPRAATERARLRSAGWARIESVADVPRVEALSEGIRSLQSAGIPTPAVFVFDEAWDVAAGLAPTFEALLGSPARLLRDVWAWRVLPGASGWPPHRGVTDDVRDAAGAPTLVNVWIALSDVTEASACMHVVPLDRDPFYPGELARSDVDRALAVPLPVPAGSLLAWNANALHWGGSASAAAPPRTSLSFSLRTMPTPGDLEPATPPSFDERVDLLADMLVTYETIAGVAGEWLEWARLWVGMKEVRG